MTAEDHSALSRSAGTWPRRTATSPSRPATCTSPGARPRTTCTGRTGSSPTRSRCRSRTTPTTRRSPAETGRNKEAVLYLMERAGCPYAVLGTKLATARCGAFDDDLEVARGWTVNPDGTDTAPTAGRFTRGDPQATSRSGPKQLGTTTSGRGALVTGKYAGKTPTAADLDGVSTVRSAPIDLPAGTGQRLTFRFVFAHDFGVDVSGQVHGDRRGREWHPDPGPDRDRQGGRPRRCLEVDLDPARPVGRPDHPYPVPGGRRRTRQPGRGRGR